jgi:hypothetical protein
VQEHDQVFDTLRSEPGPGPLTRLLKGAARGVVEGLAFPLDLLKSAADLRLPLVSRAGETLPNDEGPSLATKLVETPAGTSVLQKLEQIRRALPVQGTSGVVGFVAGSLFPLSPKALASVGRGVVEAERRAVNVIDSGRLPAALDNLYLRLFGTFHGSQEPAQLFKTGLAGSQKASRTLDEVGQPLIRTSTDPFVARDFADIDKVGETLGRVVFRARLRPEAIRDALRFRERMQEVVQQFNRVREKGALFPPPERGPLYDRYFKAYPLADMRAVEFGTPYPFSLAANEAQIAVHQPQAVSSLTAYFIPRIPGIRPKSSASLFTRIVPGELVAKAYLDQAGRVTGTKVFNPELAKSLGLAP